MRTSLTGAASVIEISTEVGPFQGLSKWFWDRPSLDDSLRLVSYVQSSDSRPRFGFVRESCRTMTVDLTRSEDALLAQISKGVQYKIRRAQREGIVCAHGRPMDEFIHFHQQMFEAGGRKVTSARVMQRAAAMCCVTRAVHGEETMAMHCYLLDGGRRARMWHSASRYVMEDSSETRNLIGRANRLLHLESMLHFKRQGYRTYDFGGYASANSDSKKQNINNFKDGFCGDIITESNYYSYALYAALLMGRWRDRIIGSSNTFKAAAAEQ